MKKITNTDSFFALLRAGLWEKEIRLKDYGEIDFGGLYQLAEDQSVVGLIAAGLEHVTDMKVTKPQVLPFMTKVFTLENRNLAMNTFIGKTVDKMWNVGIYALLVKGQGIAQCYERPLWRAAGDVDFYLDAGNYDKAKSLLLPMASSSEPEGIAAKHLGMTIDSWTVELHGTLNSGLSSRIDWHLDSIMKSGLHRGNIRTWENGDTSVFLPGQDEDIIYVFTHILQHFYKGGIGLRQICDWCRLIWSYRSSLNESLLASRLHEMRLVSEWQAFGALAVHYLGMPSEAMPLYVENVHVKRKAGMICRFVVKVGNFGHNRDNSYFSKYPYPVRKAISFGRRCQDLFHHSAIFPLDSLRFFPSIVLNGLRSAANGE